MVEWEQIDALVHWMATFEVESDIFVQEPNKLLDGRAFGQIYNSLSNDSIDLSKLKPVSNENDWVNMLLNIRQISSHISSFLKENGYEMSVDMSTLARKKDQSELLKFLKYFLLYSMKAPNRKIAITNIRSLDRSYQNHIKTILEEFTVQSSQQQGEQQTHQQHTQKASAESILQKQKIASLNEELNSLKTKSDELASQLKAKTADVEQLNANVASKMKEKINEMKAEYNEEKAKRDKLFEKVQKFEISISNMKKQIADMKENEKQINKDMEKGSFTDLTVHQLEAKLLILKQRAIGIVAQSSQLEKRPKDVKDIVELFNVSEKRSILSQLSLKKESSEKLKKMKLAELNALKSTLDAQNKIASEAMLRRVAQLNVEMDASPLGEAKRKAFRMRRIIQKFGSEIEALEKNGSAMELKLLQEEVTNMAQRKISESELLANKLSFLQSTHEQCNLRMQRLKLHVGLQIHSNRLKRWKNCFTAIFDDE